MQEIQLHDPDEQQWLELEKPENERRDHIPPIRREGTHCQMAQMRLSTLEKRVGILGRTGSNQAVWRYTKNNGARKEKATHYVNLACKREMVIDK